MSSITFATKTKEAALRGAERAYMGQVCSTIARAMLPTSESPAHPSWTRALMPLGHYAHGYTGSKFIEAFNTWFTVDGRGMRHPETGKPVDAFAVILNTALRLGYDEIRLMARLHGQCEIHGFIPPEECEFIARIIDSGRASGLYRAGMGWESVAQLLREAGASGETVVTSYSVTDSFPGWNGDTDEPNDWDEALRALNPSLAFRATGWGSFDFRDGPTVMELEAAARKRQG